MAKRVLGKDPFTPNDEAQRRAATPSDRKPAKGSARRSRSIPPKAPADTTASPAEVVTENLAVAESVEESAPIQASTSVDSTEEVVIGEDVTSRALAAPEEPQVEAASATTVETSRREEETVFDVARELLSSDYYRQQWGRAAMRSRTEEIDDFGMDPAYVARWKTVFDVLYERWWRVETRGIENVPSQGRVILCANHSGPVPYDGAMLATALRREHPSRRELRWLAEDFIFHFPFLGTFMNRIGAVRACQENAERLLRNEACVGVFPEGVKGISKLYDQRYRLQRFGRGGHIKLAIRTQTPILPVAIMGAEETHPMLASSTWLARLTGLPYLPITPTFPLLGPLGLIPLPSKWRITFLEPISVDGYKPDDADDELMVGRLNEKIRVTIQEELDSMLRNRKSVLRG